MQKVETTIPEHAHCMSTSFGSAAFYLDMGLAFSGEGVYEDNDFFVKISKAGKIEAKQKKKENKIGEDKTEHHSVAKYYGNQFLGKWYLKSQI